MLKHWAVWNLFPTLLLNFPPNDYARIASPLVLSAILKTLLFFFSPSLFYYFVSRKGETGSAEQLKIP